MMTTCRSLATLMIVLFALSTSLAQTQPVNSQPSTPVITATASTDRVRYLAAGEVNYTRLQVFSAQGAQVFDSTFKLGNLADWQLVDQQGSALVDGSYLFLVTVKDFSGTLSQKYGTAILEQGQVYLEQTQRAELPQSLSTALDANTQAETLSLVDRIGAAGLNRTASTDGTVSTPASAANTSSTGETDATGGDKDIGGAGTQNQIAKWLDNSGNLGDSIITESGGNIGIDTLSPTQKLHVAAGNLQIGSGTNSHSLLLNYTSAGGGGDITAMMNGVEMLSFGFNSTGQLGGTAGTASGRLLYFYDRQTAAYRGGFNSVGEWYWGPTTSNYGLKVAQPNVGVQGVTVEATGSVSFTGFRTQTTTGTPNVIGGFSGNSVTENVRGAVIGGGGNSGSSIFGAPLTNRVTDIHGTVGGGQGNTAGDNAGTTSNKSFATVGGGIVNTASGAVSTIGGGDTNTASGTASTVGGGGLNVASNDFATVPGGVENRAEGSASLAAGQRARAQHSGTFVWSDSTTIAPDSFFGSTAANQFLIKATGGVGIGTNAPAANLHVAGTSSAIDAPIAVIESSGTQMPLAFKNGATERARIRADNQGNLIFATLSGTERDIYFRAGADTSNTDMFIQSSTGNIGIGTTTPAHRLTIGQGTNTAPTSGASLAVFGSGEATAVMNDTSRGTEALFASQGLTLGGVNGAAVYGSATNHGVALRTNNTVRMVILPTGSVGIGTQSPADKLEVNGGNIRVSGGSFIDDGTTLNVPDYVFEDNYQLLSLDELRAYIARHKHLPKMPSAKEVRQNGLNLSQYQMKLLEKIEELTLHLLPEHKQLKEQQQLTARLQAQVRQLQGAMRGRRAAGRSFRR